MTYSPGYTSDELINTTTPMGVGIGSVLIELEEFGQKQVAESKEWLIAKRLNNYKGHYTKEDSRIDLELMGFIILRETDLFYVTTPPPLWEKSTSGYWTTIINDVGEEKITQFYKAAFYDREAFINII